MDPGEIFDYFLQYICPPLILLIGLLGNVLVILIFSRRSFKITSSKNLLITLAANEIFGTLMILVNHGTLFQFNFIYYNTFGCRLLLFLNYCSAAVTSWLLTLVTVERLVTIKYPHVKIFKTYKPLLLAVACIYGWNICIYIGRSMYVNLFVTSSNVSNGNLTFQSDALVCDVEDSTAVFSLGLIDLINSTLLPFSIMFCCSILIIRTIYAVRLKINALTSGNMTVKKKQEINRFKRDFNFSLIILGLNLIFVTFNLPICVVNLLDDVEYFVFDLVDILFYCQYIFNILVYLVANSEFKRELFIMLRFRKRLNNMTQTGYSG